LQQAFSDYVSIYRAFRLSGALGWQQPDDSTTLSIATLCDSHHEDALGTKTLYHVRELNRNA
jgi:hypothetical protein